MANEDNKNPKEASNIFHSIMKASVKPKKELDFEKIITSVKTKFGVDLTHDKVKGLEYPEEITGEKVAEIQAYIRETQKK